MIFLNIILYVGALFVVTIIITQYFKRKREAQTKIDDNFLEKLSTILGQKNNIISLKNEDERINIEVKDIKKVKIKSLRTLAKKGILVKENNIKISFEYSKDKIINYFN